MTMASPPPVRARTLGLSGRLVASCRRLKPPSPYAWGGGPGPPLQVSGEGGTRWRNEVTNGQENHAVDSHSGVALGVDMTPLRELPNTATFFGLCERGHGGPGFALHQTRNRDSV